MLGYRGLEAMWKVGRRAWEAYRELSAHVAESLQGLTTLKLFHQMDADKILVMRDGRLIEQVAL